MTTILPTGRSAFDVIGQAIGSNLERTLPQAAQQRSNRQALQQSLSNISNLTNNPNANPLDIMLATMQAGAGIPGSEKYLGTIMPELIKYAQSKREENVKRGQGIQRDVEQIPPEITNLGAVRAFPEATYFPTAKPPEGQPGRLPQKATTGQIIPMRTPQQNIEAENDIIREYRKNKIPISRKEARELVNQENQDIKNWNETVESEKKAQSGAEQKYLNKGLTALEEYGIKESSQDIQNLFKRIGEKEAERGQSEAQIESTISERAKSIANAIGNVKKDLSAPRTQNIMSRIAQGTYKNFDQSAKDIRTKIQPLLDQGLYDTARNLVSELDYYPEEVDIIVNPLSEKAQSYLNQMKQIPSKKISTTYGNEVYAPLSKREISYLADILVQTSEADPNFSLPLARKMAEDYDINWRGFKDALNLAIAEKGLKLSQDQQNRISLLDYPPLTNLQKSIEAVNIRGR